MRMWCGMMGNQLQLSMYINDKHPVTGLKAQLHHVHSNQWEWDEDYIEEERKPMKTIWLTFLNHDSFTGALWRRDFLNQVFV